MDGEVAMGKRDYRHREPKKQKKAAKKITVDTILSPSETIEVIKKGKKEAREEE